jgi:hypothetical protein
MAAACFGIENNLGSLITPLRHCYNKAENGFNTLNNGENIFFISTPSAGLWTTKDKMKNPFFHFIAISKRTIIAKTRYKVFSRHDSCIY